MSAWRLRIAIAGAPLVAACAAVLGIDELPLAVKPPDPPPEIEVRSPDPPDACATDASFCVRTCPAFEFCDDFETETSAFERWKPPGIIPKPFKSGVLETVMAIVPGAPPERGMVLTARAQSQDNGPQTLALVHQLKPPRDGKRVQGIYMRVRGQLAELTFPADAVSHKHVGIFGIASSSLTLNVASFMIYDRGPDIAIAAQQRDPFGKESPVELFVFDDVPRSRLEADWPVLELVVGSRSTLTSNGFPCALAGDVDASTDDAGEAGIPAADPMVVVLRALGFSACAPLVGELADPEWLQTPLLFTGAFVTDYGALKFLFDDVGVRYLF